MTPSAAGEWRALADHANKLGFEGGIPRASQIRSITLYVTEHVTSNSHSFVASRLTETVNDFKDSYHRETHRYDALGREIEKAEWNRDGSIINRRTYIYSTDSLGNWTRRTEMFSSSAMNEPVEGEVTVRSIDYY